MASVMAVAAVPMTGLALVSGEGLAAPHGADWGWICVVTFGPGGMGHLLLAWSHRHVEAWLGALITQCQPVVGAAAAWVLLGESLSVLTMVGGLIVLAATAAIVVRSRRRTPLQTFEEPESPAPAG